MKLKSRKKGLKFFRWIFNHKKLFLLPAVLSLFLFIFYLFIFSDFLTVKKINMLSPDLSCVQNAQIKTTLNLFGKNILFLSLEKSEEVLKAKFLCIKKVDFSKSLPSTLKINVFQREAKMILSSVKLKESSDSAIERLINTPASESARLLSYSEEYVVDEEGIIFSEKKGENLNKAYIFLDLSLGKKVEKNLILDLLKINENFKDLGIEINEMVIDEEDLLINSVPRVVFKLNSQTDKQLAALQLILNIAKIDDASVEFIDLRFDKPVVKYGKR